MKNGSTLKTLIGTVAEGVNDVQARFTPTGEHVLYYNNGHQTLRAFRVADGQLIGTFRPHAQITTWTCDHKGEKIVIGGQDGSLLTSVIYDAKVKPEIQKTLALLPTRRYLAEHLGIPQEELDKDENLDLRNLAMITKAAAKFKQSVRNKNQPSAVCSI
ncbi:Protein T05C3.2, partial [Aphelenchoides avenae]